MKRTKQVEIMIEQVNNYLRLNHINSISNEVFNMFTFALIKANVYHGYNYYNANGQLDNLNVDYIQIY